LEPVCAMVRQPDRESSFCVLFVCLFFLLFLALNAMNLWLLIPVKPFSESKSRLAPVLTAEDRAALSRQLLEGVIALAQETRVFQGIVVVSRDAHVLSLAGHLGVVALHETVSEVEALLVKHSGNLAGELVNAGNQKQETTLNQALFSAQAHAQAAGADAILVLPADLPLVTVEDVQALIEPAMHQARMVVIAPSHDGGTNALLLRPPSAIPFAFGIQSYARHHALARAAGLPLTVVQTPSLTYDLDLPEDLWGEDLGI
jgi:2-phospho-L-lactate/phosphoenolpyruvate guanylyltransferase